MAIMGMGFRVVGQVNNPFDTIVKYDTVKCWVVTADSSKHLVLSKAWAIRKWLRYWDVSDGGFDIMVERPFPYKYLAPNRRDSLAVLDFKPIIQEWK